MEADVLELILFWIYVFLGDRANYWCKEHMFNLRGELIFNMQRYIVGRIISAVLLGWLTIPIVGGWKLIGLLKTSSHKNKNKEHMILHEEGCFSQEETCHTDYKHQDDKVITSAIKENDRQCPVENSQGNGKYSIEFFACLAKEMLKEFHHGIVSLLKNDKMRIPSIAIFIALCTSGLIVPVLIIGIVLFVGLMGYVLWKD